MPTATTLQQVLDQPEAHSSDLWLFLEPLGTWHLSQAAVVADIDSVPDPDALVVDNTHFQPVLQVGVIQDVARNLVAQGARPSSALMLRAFRFYYENDAFLELA
jgi:hypothetical protein